MTWDQIGYALACVVVPVAWGLVVLLASNAIEGMVLRHGRRKDQGNNDATLPPIEYHI